MNRTPYHRAAWIGGTLLWLGILGLNIRIMPSRLKAMKDPVD